LNCDGKFILIFDGFDEMARQVSYQTTVNNFDELAKAAAGDAKVLLTCRKHYFHEAREERSILSGEASARNALEHGGETRKDEPASFCARGFETVLSGRVYARRYYPPLAKTLSRAMAGI